MMNLGLNLLSIIVIILSILLGLLLINRFPMSVERIPKRSERRARLK